jgi:hypothetical protein
MARFVPYQLFGNGSCTIVGEHHAAVRGLAFKWIRIVFRCWKDRVTYDESRYLAALAKRNSALAAVAAGTIL